MIISFFSLQKHPFFVKPQDTLSFTTSVRHKMWNLYLLPEEIFIPVAKTLRPYSTLSSLRVLRSCSTRSQIRWSSRKQGWLVCRNPQYGYNMRRSHRKAETRVDYVRIYSSRRKFFFFENHTSEDKGKEKQKKKGGRNEEKTKLKCFHFLDINSYKLNSRFEDSVSPCVICRRKWVCDVSALLSRPCYLQ